MTTIKAATTIEYIRTGGTGCYSNKYNLIDAAQSCRYSTPDDLCVNNRSAQCPLIYNGSDVMAIHPNIFE